jgi:hypothetical protein
MLDDKCGNALLPAQCWHHFAGPRLINLASNASNLEKARTQVDSRMLVAFANTFLCCDESSFPAACLPGLSTQRAPPTTVVSPPGTDQRWAMP